MANYIKSYNYNGSVITLQLRPNAGPPYTDPVTGATESTHTIYATIGGLTALTPFAAAATGISITDGSLAGKWISYLTVNGGAPIYSVDFEKDPAGSTITFTTGVSVVAGDTIAVFYLPDGSGVPFDGIRKGGGLLKAEAQRIEDNMKVEIDGTADAEINTWFTDLGYTRE